jgi:hypothetical protein
VTISKAETVINPVNNTGRLAHFLNIISIALLFTFSISTFEQLPKKIPMHFNAAGVADSYVQKSWATWLMLPLMALGMTIVFYLSALLIKFAKKNPKWLSLPNKEKFLALPPEKQEPIWQLMKNMLYWIALPTNLMIFCIHYSIYQISTTQGKNLSLWPTIAFGLGILFVTFFFTFKLIRKVRKI